jgi:hypothetical protein
MHMKDFTVSRFGTNGEKELQAYIGFEDRRSDDHNQVLCYGSAFVRLKDEDDLLLGYWSGPSATWDKVTDIVLNPFKKNILEKKEMDKIGKAIITHIIQFISQAN